MSRVPTDAHDLIGAYALDALGKRERARFLVHLADCPRCRQELTALRAASAELDDLTP